MQFITYWETPKNTKVPPWILLCLTIMRIKLGKQLRVLGPKCIEDLFGTEFIGQQRCFNKLEFQFNCGRENIVARSDAIRIAYIYHFGGTWLDADTLLLKKPIGAIYPNGVTERLHWSSEAIFGAKPNNRILKEALNNMSKSATHDWGDPGQVKALVKNNPRAIEPISPTIFDPGYTPTYRFQTCDTLNSKTVSVDSFIKNEDLTLLKLYNTYFTRTAGELLSVMSFLRSNTLLANIFLTIEPNLNFWANESKVTEEYLISINS